MFLFNDNISLGVDMSDFKLRLVQLKKTGKKTKVISFSEVEVPPGVIIDGAIQSKDHIAELIDRLKKRIIGYRLLTNNIIVGLPEKQSFVKLIETSKINGKGIEIEMSKHLPFNLNDIYYDYQILSSTPWGSNPALHCAAAKKDIVNDYLEIFNRADWEAEVIELETMAIARCLLPQKIYSPKTTSVIIDIGTARTTISIVCQKMIIFSISFNSIIHQTKAYLSDLLINLRQVLEFYQQHLEAHNLLLDAIYTCGSGAYFQNLNTEIEKNTGLRSLLGNPWQNISQPLNHCAKKIKYPLAFATAIGLALRPIESKNYI
jgi:Tfp pilus assembly PilM family ATPase